MANFQQLSVEEAANAVKRGWVVAQMLEYITIELLEYDSVADVPESWVCLRADFLNLFLSISMAYNVISCQKDAENTQILKIAKFAM